MAEELSALEAALGKPERPVVAVVGGAKVSSKLDLLSNLVGQVDHLVIGGGMANTFLAAQGHAVGKSLCEHDLAETARRILQQAQAAGCEIILPSDIVVAREFAAHAPHETVAAEACPDDAMILDAGPETVARIGACFSRARTLIWNGPLGAFEMQPFDRATNAAAQSAATLIRWPRSIKPEPPMALAISLRLAARFWNGWRAKICRAWPRLSHKNVKRPLISNR
jgi:phosphoglycerate kinase